ARMPDATPRSVEACTCALANFSRAFRSPKGFTSLPNASKIRVATGRRNGGCFPAFGAPNICPSRSISIRRLHRPDAAEYGSNAANPTHGPPWLGYLARHARWSGGRAARGRLWRPHLATHRGTHRRQATPRLLLLRDHGRPDRRDVQASRRARTGAPEQSAR